jgi:hypothetical protein
MKKVIWILAFVAVFAAGFATHAVSSRMCKGGSCDRHASMNCGKHGHCCKKDGACDKRTEAGAATSAVAGNEIDMPKSAGEEKACCKKGHGDHHASMGQGECCRKTAQGDVQACCKKHEAGEPQDCCKKS